MRKQAAAQLGLMLISRRHESARAAPARRCRQLGFRLFRRVLPRCDAGALGAALPDVQLRDAELPALIAAICRRARRERHLRAFDGRARRADLRAAQSAEIQIGVRIRADRGADALSLGTERVRRYLGADQESWRKYDASELVAHPSLSRNDPHRSGNDRPISGRAIAAREFAAAAAASGQPVDLRMQPGYDHGYYFIQSFMADHLRHHAAHLIGAA
jgi:hypothetical protein